MAMFTLHIYRAGLLYHAVIVMHTDIAQGLPNSRFKLLVGYRLLLHFLPATAVDEDGIG